MTDDIGGLDRVVANGRLFTCAVKSGAPDTAVGMACECTSPRCDRRVAITPRDYRPVRSSANWYIVCSHDDHVDHDLDHVVDRRPAYWVIERRDFAATTGFHHPREQARVGDDR